VVKNDIRRQGAVARTLKLGKSSNPWQKGSEEYFCWLDGYCEEKQREYIRAYDGDRSGFYH